MGRPRYGRTKILAAAQECCPIALGAPGRDVAMLEPSESGKEEGRDSGGESTKGSSPNYWIIGWII
jgi:hypothetical protein